MHDDPVERYLTEIRDIFASHAHVAETSFYPPLVALLSEIGHDIVPKVRCIMHPSDHVNEHLKMTLYGH